MQRILHRYITPLTIILVLITLLIPRLSTAAPTFTGDAAADFANSNAARVDDLEGDVGLPAPDFPAGSVSGWDISAVYLEYDPAADILYVGIDCVVICGDADGDGDPDVTGPILGKPVSSGGLGGQDVADWGRGEAFGLLIDTNNDFDGTNGDFEVVVGVRNSATIADFGAYAYSGRISAQLRNTGWGAALPNAVTLFAPTSSTVADLEFTIADFSTLPGFSAGGTMSYKVHVGMGSVVDDGIGEDFAPDQLQPVEITPTPTTPPTATNTPVPTNTPTPMPTDTPVPTDTPAPTNTPIPTDTPLPTPTLTATPVPTDTPAPTNTPIPTDTPTATNTLVPTEPPTNTPTNTPEPTATNTLIPTEPPTNTPTNTPEPTATNTLIPTEPPTNTPTNTPEPSPTPTMPPPTSVPTTGADLSWMEQRKWTNPPIVVHKAALEKAVVSGQPTFLEIPSLQLSTAVESMGWDRAIAADGALYSRWDDIHFAAGWMRNSARPGDAGNVVMSGHNNVYGAVFRDLWRIQAGEPIVVHSDGERFVYVVDSVIVRPEWKASDEQRAVTASYIEQTTDQRLTLVSCWPPNSNTHRVFVEAHLVPQQQLSTSSQKSGQDGSQQLIQ